MQNPFREDWQDVKLTDDFWQDRVNQELKTWKGWLQISTGFYGHKEKPIRLNELDKVRFEAVLGLIFMLPDFSCCVCSHDDVSDRQEVR